MELVKGSKARNLKRLWNFDSSLFWIFTFPFDFGENFEWNLVAKYKAQIA